jgi:prophage DNA circulation protein
MDNNEIERLMNFIIERQEVFASNMEAAQADTQALKQSVATLTERVTHITNVVGELVDAQQGFLQGQERMQGDISNMLKITAGLFETIMKNGGAPSSEDTP